MAAGLCASLPGLGHLGRELKLLNLEARQAGKWKSGHSGTIKSSCPRVGVLYWAPTLSRKAPYLRDHSPGSGTSQLLLGSGSQSPAGDIQPP